MVYAKHLLSFFESGIFVNAGQGIPAWPAPSKKSAHCLSWAFLVDSISHVLSELAGESCVKGLLGARAWFPIDLAPCAFSLGWLCWLCGCNKSSLWEQLYAQSLSHPRKSSYLEFGLGTPNTEPCILLFSPYTIEDWITCSMPCSFVPPCFLHMLFLLPRMLYFPLASPSILTGVPLQTVPRNCFLREGLPTKLQLTSSSSINSCTPHVCLIFITCSLIAWYPEVIKGRHHVLLPLYPKY